MNSLFPGTPSTILIIGIGNEFRSDGNVGRINARTLEDLDIPNVSIVESSGDGVELRRLWAATESVVVIEAFEGAGEPGAVLRVVANEGALPLAMFHSSSHEFGLAHAIELSRNLRDLPPSLIVYGIRGKNFSGGTNLSPEVERSMTQVLGMILQDVKALQDVSRPEEEF